MSRAAQSVRPYPAWTPWAFMLPFLAVFGAFIVWPLINSLVLSLEHSYGPAHTTFVGLRNFQLILGDPEFWNAVRNTVIFACGSVFLQLPLALGLALLLDRPLLRGRAIYRLIFFSPYLVGLVFAALIFSFIFEKRTGLINRTLHALVSAWDPEFPWLQNYAVLTLVLVGLWLYVGLNMVYFLAALQNVPKDLLDAASIDGAGRWHRFRHVTLPQILPVGSFVVLLSIIGSLQLFELPWVLLTSPNQPIPDERGTTIVVYLYKMGFITQDLGYASAIGWILALVLIGIALAQRRILRGREEN
ncbi:MAG TPA: sugar ABC transporter permease [Candidatus Krumholzibacteria bacterium]